MSTLFLQLEIFYFIVHIKHFKIEDIPSKKERLRMIKCNADICKFINKEKTQCTLEDISLNFSSDYERWGCYCEQFKESDEYRKSTYELKKIDESVFLIIKTDVLEEPDSEMIMQELPCIEEATIYFKSNSGFNRLFKAIKNKYISLRRNRWKCSYK